MFDLTGKVALVTGSTTGLGKSMALHLGRAGAMVALNYANNVERAEKTLASSRRRGGALFRGSVDDADSVTRLEEEIRESSAPSTSSSSTRRPRSPSGPSRSTTGSSTSRCSTSS